MKKKEKKMMEEVDKELDVTSNEFKVVNAFTQLNIKNI